MNECCLDKELNADKTDINNADFNFLIRIYQHSIFLFAKLNGLAL